MGDIADYYRSHQNEYDAKEKIKPLLHRCRDGRIVDIRGVSKDHPKMEDDHLLNTINYINRKAKEGIIKRIGGGWDFDSFWYEEEIIKGKEAKRMMKYKKYKKEAIKRGLL